MYLFDKVKTIASCDGLSAAVADEAAFIRLNSSEYVLFPGFCDVHVHFREPGFSYKETILSGSLAAAHGGYTAVCTMPNLNPVPDCPEKLRPQREQIARDAVMAVFPYGAISVDEKGEQLADLEGLAPLVCAFSDDGHGVQDAGMMREAMQRCRALGKLIAAHCEDNSLLHGGCIHDGAWARAHGYRGISSESEWRQIERDLRLRDAKSSGVDVSCETAPHYLLLDENDLQEDGRFKMNPPLRAREDREALLEGLTDGTVDMIATDHAPHSAEEKSRGLEKSAFGIVGLETAFPLLYTGLVQRGILGLSQLVDLLTRRPRSRFGLPGPDGFSIWDLNAAETVDPDAFLSKGHATPFAGRPVSARCLLTVYKGNVIYNAEDEQHG